MARIVYIDIQPPFPTHCLQAMKMPSMQIHRLQRVTKLLLVIIRVRHRNCCLNTIRQIQTPLLLCLTESSQNQLKRFLINQIILLQMDLPMLQATLQRTLLTLPKRIILVRRIKILPLMPLQMPPNLSKRMPQTTLHILIPLKIMPMSQSLKTLPLMTTKLWAMIILRTITLFKKILMRWLWSQRILSKLSTVIGMIHMCSTLRVTLQMIMMMSIITSMSIKGIITTTIPI